MKIATVREVQHALAALLERVELGEEITVTRRGRPVARIVPVEAKRKGRRPRLAWPDFEARLKQDFPGGALPGIPASELLRDLRKERL